MNENLNPRHMRSGFEAAGSLSLIHCPRFFLMQNQLIQIIVKDIYLLEISRLENITFGNFTIHQMDGIVFIQMLLLNIYRNFQIINHIGMKNLGL